MALTPGKHRGVHNLQGTIYEKVVDGDYTYHMHAEINPEAKKEKAVWTIWREHVDGQLVPPIVNDAPRPDGNIATDPTALTYWATS